MKSYSLFFSIFLSIFLTGCEKEQVDGNPLGLGINRGTSVDQEPYCNQLGRVDPIEVRKHELPIHLQTLRDFCTHLIALRNEELAQTSDQFLQCDLMWVMMDQEKTNLLEEFFRSEGNKAPSFTELQETGDIYHSERGLSLFIEIQPDDQALYFWRQEQLWPRLSKPLPDFESLVWRFNIQTPLQGICSTHTSWEQSGSQFLIHGHRACENGKVFDRDYTIDESGILLDQEQRSLEDISCIHRF